MKRGGSQLFGKSAPIAGSYRHGPPEAPAPAPKSDAAFEGAPVSMMGCTGKSVQRLPPHPAPGPLSGADPATVTSAGPTSCVGVSSVASEPVSGVGAPSPGEMPGLTQTPDRQTRP